jgi:S-adenosylmethionine:tRNA ribosyltransferase-isomerase
MFQKTDYTYELPPWLIAEEAAHPHHDARLMVVDRLSGTIECESTFWHLDEFLGKDRVIFFNNSRVLRARIALRDTPYTDTRWEKKILDEWEIFYLKTTESGIFEALVRPGNKFKVGNTFTIGEFTLEVIGMTEAGRVLKVQNTELTIENLLATHGALPLPPYIEYSEEKEKDYQTAFAEKDGSVAAPTASLHFTQELLTKIANDKKYVTLHVGLGTFKWIDTSDIREYAIHSESVEIDIDTLVEIAQMKLRGKRIVAVGTTACRTLESLPSLWKKIDTIHKDKLDANICNYWNNVSGSTPENNWIDNIHFDNGCKTISFDTSIYITPWYTFQMVDDLITNFHLPESSLLVLVSAFVGHENIMHIYKTAVEEQFRFYSFWDWMYIRWN